MKHLLLPVLLLAILGTACAGDPLKSGGLGVSVGTTPTTAYTYAAPTPTTTPVTPRATTVTTTSPVRPRSAEERFDTEIKPYLTTACRTWWQLWDAIDNASRSRMEALADQLEVAFMKLAIADPQAYYLASAAEIVAEEHSSESALASAFATIEEFCAGFRR